MASEAHEFIQSLEDRRPRDQRLTERRKSDARSCHCSFHTHHWRTPTLLLNNSPILLLFDTYLYLKGLAHKTPRDSGLTVIAYREVSGQRKAAVVRRCILSVNFRFPRPVATTG